MDGGEAAAAAFGIGVCTGLRALTPICVLALLEVPATGLFALLFGWPLHKIVFLAAAAGELVWDKLPNCPSRMEPPGMIGRVVFGGLSAAVVSSASGTDAVMPGLAVLAGIAGAVLGAIGGNRFRMTVGERWPWPAALAEDAVCIAGSVAIARMLV